MFAFNFNLRRYTLASTVAPNPGPNGGGGGKGGGAAAIASASASAAAAVTASALAAHAAAAAGAARWLAEASARAKVPPPPPLPLPSSTSSTLLLAPRLASLLPMLPSAVDSWGTPGSGGHVHASEGATPHGSLGAAVAGLLEGGGGGMQPLVCALVSAAAARWDATHADPKWGDMHRAGATRDLAAATVGVVEGLTGAGAGGATAREDAALAALAAALRGEVFTPASGAAVTHVTRVLLPRLLLHELREAPQKRCARVWLSALALCRHLIQQQQQVGPGRYCSPRHIMPIHNGTGFQNALPTLRVTYAGP